MMVHSPSMAGGMDKESLSTVTVQFILAHGSRDGDMDRYDGKARLDQSTNSNRVRVPTSMRTVLSSLVSSMKI